MHVQIFLHSSRKLALKLKLDAVLEDLRNNFAACCLLASFDLEILKGGDLLNYRLASVHNNTKK
mgnify:CR=1 FL=1